MNYNAYKTGGNGGPVEREGKIIAGTNGDIDDIIIVMNLMIEERRREARDKKINQILEAIDNKNS